MNHFLKRSERLLHKNRVFSPCFNKFYHCTFEPSLIEPGTKPPDMQVKYMAREGYTVINYILKDYLGHISEVGSYAEGVKRAPLPW